MEPTTVTERQQRAAYYAFGLDPELYNRTAEIVITPLKVEVIRYRQDVAGYKYIDLETGSPAVEVAVLTLASKVPAP